MKPKILHFKDEIFVARKNSQIFISPKLNYKIFFEKLKTLKNDLLVFLDKEKKTFSKNDRLLAKITFSDKFAAKSNRCLREIFLIIGKRKKTYKTINKPVKNSNKNYSLDKLRLYLVFELSRDEINAILQKIELIKTLNLEQLEIYLKEKKHEYDSIIFPKIGIKKTTLSFFIQQMKYYHKISYFNNKKNLPPNNSLLVEFLSKTSLNIFLKINKIDSSQYDDLSENLFLGQIIIICLKSPKKTLIMDLVFKFEENRCVESLNSSFTKDTQSDCFELGSKRKNLKDYLLSQTSGNYPIIGVFDTKINSDNSIFSPFLKKDNFYSNNEKNYSYHAEMILSSLFFGVLDKKGERIDDGCITPNVKLFSIFNKKNTLLDIMRQIDFSVKQNKDIKIWNLSWNYDNYNYLEFYGVPTFLATFLDLLQQKNNIIFVQSSGNNSIEGEKAKSPITPPAEASLSIVVNASEQVDSKAPFSTRHTTNIWTNKPDLSIWSGTFANPGFAVVGDYLLVMQGTSFSAPLVARRLAHILYHYGQLRYKWDEKSLIINSKTILISSAFLNNSHEKYDEFLGWGRLPQKIDQSFNTEGTHLFFSGSSATKYAEFSNLKLPDHNKRKTKTNPFNAYLIFVYQPILNFAYGAEYVRELLDIKIRKNTKSKDKWREWLLFKKSSDYYEKNLVGAGKWKLIFCVFNREGSTNSKQAAFEKKHLIKITKQVKHATNNIEVSKNETKFAILLVLKHFEKKEVTKEISELNNENIIFPQINVSWN